MSGANEVDEIECEAAQSVLVGHIQSAYLASHDFLQNLVKPRPFEVESTPGVGDDGAMGTELIDEARGLRGEKAALFAGGDSGIDDIHSASVIGRTRLW